MTAWYLRHRIRPAMKEVNPEPLNGVVEMDETFLGGKFRGLHVSEKIVVGIKQRGGELRFFKAEDVKAGTLAKYIKETISADLDVMMKDDWLGYPRL